jgi:hypothetical protein
MDLQNPCQVRSGGLIEASLPSCSTRSGVRTDRLRILIKTRNETARARSRAPHVLRGKSLRVAPPYCHRSAPLSGHVLKGVPYVLGTFLSGFAACLAIWLTAHFVHEWRQRSAFIASLSPAEREKLAGFETLKGDRQRSGNCYASSRP